MLTTPVLEVSGVESERAALSASYDKGAIKGPLAIVNPQWPRGTHMIARILGSDNTGRVYAVGTKGTSYEYFLARILPGIDANGDGRADMDPAFGAGGFAPMRAPQGVVIDQAARVMVSENHVTISVEVAAPGGVLETALFRFSLDGQPDPLFGASGFAVFDELPEPSASAPQVAGMAHLSPWKGEEVQRTQPASISRSLEMQLADEVHQATAATGSDKGDALVTEKLLVVAHKKRRGAKLSYLIKVGADGAPDASFADGVGYLPLVFGGSLSESEYKMAVDSVGRAMIVSTSEDRTHCLVARFCADGRLDSTFGANGILLISSTAGSMYRPFVAVDGNDKAVVCTQLDPGGPAAAGVYIFRLEEDGAADPTFNGGQPLEFSPVRPIGGYRVDSIDVDEDHNVLLRGIFRQEGSAGFTSVLVSRFNAHGIDAGFGDGGSFALSGWGSSGGLAAQAGASVVVSDRNYLWQLTA
jgi:uncharacterized delta-60 repeat protein